MLSNVILFLMESLCVIFISFKFCYKQKKKKKILLRLGSEYQCSLLLTDILALGYNTRLGKTLL